MFQFHSGSIKGCLFYADVSFLEEKFQFHSGSIKGRKNGVIPDRCSEFQFHSGSIKGQEGV